MKNLVHFCKIETDTREQKELALCFHPRHKNDVESTMKRAREKEYLVCYAAEVDCLIDLFV